jgi:hypothetical protein
MTDQDLEELGKQAWRAQRTVTDPVLKLRFALLHKQTLELRKRTGGPGLEAALRETVRGLLRS